MYKFLIITNKDNIKEKQYDFVDNVKKILKYIIKKIEKYY